MTIDNFEVRIANLHKNVEIVNCVSIAKKTILDTCFLILDNQNVGFVAFANFVNPVNNRDA